MARWRAAAIERLPELRDVIAAASNVMALWTEIQFLFHKAYEEPRNDDLIARIYSYADWCASAPSGPDAGHDAPTAVTICFYEHVPTDPKARQDMPRWFRYEEVVLMKQVFSYLTGEREYENLLVFMSQNRHRYVPRETTPK